MASSPPVIAAIYYPASVRPAARSSDFAGDDSHVEPRRREALLEKKINK